jgi:hypothetical protein
VIWSSGERTDMDTLINAKNSDRRQDVSGLLQRYVDPHCDLVHNIVSFQNQ